MWLSNYFAVNNYKYNMQHMQQVYLKKYLFIFLLFFTGFQACQKNNIEFGDTPEDSYTRLINIDTIGVSMSTVVTDSFTTSGNDNYLLGRYKDTVTGTTSAKVYFELGIPDNINLPADAQYDSVALIVKTNKYFYGDTSLSQTITVNELSAKIEHTYNDKLYNTSAITANPIPLGQKTIKINPSTTDSLFIKLNDVRGNQLFTKMKQKADEVKTVESFLQYFKGIVLAFANTDTTMVMGISAATNNIKLRIYYHKTIPFFEKANKDFPLLVNQFSFNQLRINRAGTYLHTAAGGRKEIPSAQTNNQSFSQTSTGVLLKITFPSLKNILYLNKINKLLKAELILKPVEYTFNSSTYKLPPTLFLFKTDASNIIGYQLSDANGFIGGQPFTDNIYKANSNYTFAITSYVNDLLQPSSTSDNGLYLMEDYPGQTKQINRALFGSKQHPLYKAQLILSVLTTKD
jgi:Domain of unknown function (DUF4270)